MRWRDTSRITSGTAFCGTMALAFALFPQRAMALPPDTSPKPIRISAVASPRESVVIDLFAQGCYSGVGIREHYRFHYTATPHPAISVRALELPFLSTARQKRVRLGELGTVTLTPEEAVRLDNLFHFYRRNHKGRLLFTSTITVALFDGGKKRQSEQFRNIASSAGICADATAQDLEKLDIADAPTLSLARVINRAREAHRQHLSSIAYATPDRKHSQAYIKLQSKIQEKEAEAKARKIVEALPGYAEMQSTFTLSKVRWDKIAPDEGLFYMHLDAKTPRLIDGGDWFDYKTEHGSTLYDWNRFLSLQNALDRIVADHTWIADWKRAGPGRSVTFCIRGETPRDDNDDKYQRIDLPAWQRAGLQGKPEYELSFDWDTVSGFAASQVLFSHDDPHALVIQAFTPSDKSDQRHWFDTLHVENWPLRKTSPDYVVISPDGKWQGPIADAR